MGAGTRILVVHSDHEWHCRLQSTFGGGLVTAATAEDALRSLESEPAELVVADDSVGVGFLEEVSKRSPTTPRAILLNGGDRRRWLEAAAEGHRFAAIPESAPDLAARLQALVRVQAEGTSVLSGCTVAVVARQGALRVSGPLLRLGSESLTFRLEPGEALEAFLPGQDLDSVVVRRGQDVVIEGPAASVKDLLPDHTGGFELEMTLAAPAAPALPQEVIRDPMQRASLVGEAMRRGRLVVETSEGEQARAVPRGRVDALAEVAFLEGLPHAFAPGAMARFSFDAGGAHFQFVAALLPHREGPRDGLAVSLPAELRGRRRRRRRTTLVAGEATAQIATRLSSGLLSRPVIDVELEGMGVLVEPGDLLPVGTRLDGILLELADGTCLKATGRIASRAPIQGPAGPAVRCGVHFDRLAPEEQTALAGAILRRTHPGLELGRGMTFDTLWCFMRETGFLYPEKEEKLRPVLPQVQATLGRLLAEPEGPLRTLLFRTSGILAGHLSVARAYRSTWMVQHLAVCKDGPGKLAAAHALNVGMVDYLEQLPDAEWLRVWFRPNNRWPARTFGRFARLQYDPHRNDLRTFAYLVAPTVGQPSPISPGVTIGTARHADWAEFRRHMVSSGQTAILAAEDLCEAPDLSVAGSSYRQLGLERRREALVARRGGRLVGYALLEISSLGVNLSELTNAFRLQLLDPDPAVAGALAAAARDRYAELGRPMAVGLCERPNLAAWASAGFSQAKSYSCWTVRISLLRRYVEFIDRLYECLPSRAIRGRA